VRIKGLMDVIILDRCVADVVSTDSKVDSDE